jgi:hypothetical protein
VALPIGLKLDVSGGAPVRRAALIPMIRPLGFSTTNFVSSMFLALGRCSDRLDVPLLAGDLTGRAADEHALARMDTNDHW